jgi:hypothetical protein
MHAVPSAEASPTKAQMKQNTDGRTTPQEPFDYSAVPNILDDILTPEHDATSRKKKKHKQNAGEPVPILRSYLSADCLSSQVVSWSMATFLHRRKLNGSLKMSISPIPLNDCPW